MANAISRASSFEDLLQKIVEECKSQNLLTVTPSVVRAQIGAVKKVWESSKDACETADAVISFENDIVVHRKTGTTSTFEDEPINQSISQPQPSFFRCTMQR